MATPNYGYEKRQRELAKRKKKEDKLRAKADRKAGIVSGEPGEGHDAASPPGSDLAGLGEGEPAPLVPPSGSTA